MKHLLIPFLVFISILSHGQTTIILVRHAEKEESSSRDPDLSAKGKERVAALERMLSEVPIDQFYSTPYKRTRQTVSPLAFRRAGEVKEYNPAAQDAFAMSLKSYKGQTILVAGHSNTIPGLVNHLLGEPKFQNIAEDEYDNVFVVTVTDDTATVIRLKY